MKRRQFFQRRNSSETTNKSPVFLGISVSSCARKLEAAAVGILSVAEGRPIVLYKSASFDLPEEVTRTFRELKQLVQNELLKTDPIKGDESGDGAPREVFVQNSSEGANRSSLQKVAELRSMFAAVQEEAVSELFNGDDSLRERTVALSISSPSLFLPSYDWDERKVVVSLDDPRHLVQRTGLNVVSSLSSSDPSAGRESLLLYPYWVLLGDPDRSKILVDLGETARIFYIPALTNARDFRSKALFSNAVPCGSLLNSLTEQATKGDSDIDAGGKLSVQGRCVGELLEAWREGTRTICEKNAVGRYATFGGTDNLNECYHIEQILRQKFKISAADALCTAVHWIAEQIFSRFSRGGFDDGSTGDLLLMGGAKQNGLLLSKLSGVFSPRRLRPFDDLEVFSEDSLAAVATAMLGAFRCAGRPVLWREGDELKEGSVGRTTLGSESSVRLLRDFLFVNSRSGNTV